MSAVDLGGGGFFEWLALRRVHDGGLVLTEDGYVQHGRAITGEVAEAIGRLLDAGALALGQPDPRGHRTVCVTATGQAWYAEAQGGGGRG